MKFRIFLKIYLVLIVFLFPFTLWMEATDDQASRITDVLDYVFWLIAIIGVVGYSYQKTILSASFWKKYLPFVIGWDAFIVYYEVTSDPELFTDEFGLGFVVAIVLIGFLILLPQYIAIYLYGYKTNT